MKSKEQLKKIKYLVIDVDGTMTDAGIYYDEHGNELKKFCTKDAAGFFTAHQAGMEILVLTGRECAATTRRMTEMKVDYLVQNCKDKVTYLNQFMQEKGITGDVFGYLGDDLNDLPGMQLYTGNFIVKEEGKEGAEYTKRNGVCFETQYFPNSINIPSFESCVLKAGDTFTSTTIYKFC